MNESNDWTIVEQLGTFRRFPVYLMHFPGEHGELWSWCCRCASGGHYFPTEGEARAYAAGRYGFAVERCAAPSQTMDTVTLRPYSFDRRRTTITLGPDGKFVLARGGRGYAFGSLWDAYAYAVGRNWADGVFHNKLMNRKWERDRQST